MKFGIASLLPDRSSMLDTDQAVTHSLGHFEESLTLDLFCGH